MFRLPVGIFLAQLMICAIGYAQPASMAEEVSDFGYALPQDTLTGNWFGLGKKLADKGLSVNLTLTQLYQQNASGGTSTHRRAGRYSGRYDLEFDADMEKLFNITGGRVYALARGGWSNGINDYSVGSIFGVNGLEFGNEPIQLWELYYEQRLLNDTVLARFGKLDLTSGFECHDCPATFDGNTYANDEALQFLNNSLINNPTIPFPDPGLGAILHIAPVEWFYISAAVTDADAEYTDSGFNTAFSGPTNLFSIYELGFMPRLPSKNGKMHGAYRAGFWYDPQAKERFDGNGKKSDDMGYYFSFDQMLFKENAVEGDTQGLGVFARYGWADGDVNEITNFWSVGAQYQGLIEGRNSDILAVGVGQGILSRHADFTASNETALECYYKIDVTPWLNISPDVQYIFNPGGDSSVQNAVVLGVRIGITF